MSCIVKKETSTSIVPPMENRHFKLWPMAAPRFRRKWIIIDLCLERFSKIRFGKFSRGSNFIFYFVNIRHADINIESQRSSRAVFRGWKTEPPHIFRNVGFAVRETWYGQEIEHENARRRLVSFVSFHIKPIVHTRPLWMQDAYTSRSLCEV